MRKPPSPRQASVNRSPVPGMQVGHAGRKASSEVPWRGGVPIPPDAGGWVPVGPSAIPFGETSTVPHELSTSEIAATIADFAATTRMARESGFKIIELHGAHGYLGHSFTYGAFIFPAGFRG